MAGGAAALAALVCLLSAPPSSGDCGVDALSLVQVTVERPRPWVMPDVQWATTNTIGNVAPRMIDEGGADVAHAMATPATPPKTQTAMSEAQAEMLAAAIGASLSRVGRRLDAQMDLTVELKERLLRSRDQVGQSRLEALENVTMNSMQAISEGWSNIDVVLRSTVQGIQSKLEMASQIELSAQMGRSLGEALSQHDSASQTVFDAIRVCAAGLGKESPAGAARRIQALRAPLQAYRQSANSFAHSLHRQFQALAEAIGARAAESKLLRVVMQRVTISFDEVRQCAEGIAWKTYSSAWILTAGILMATSDLSGPGDLEPQIGREFLAGEVAAPGESSSALNTPMKPRGAQSVTAALGRVEKQADALMRQTMEQTGSLLAALSSPRSTEEPAEAQIRRVIGAVLPSWSDLGNLLKSISTDISRCLEVAGQHELARKLSSMTGEAVLRDAALTNYSRASAAQGVSTALEAFLQQEDVVAHLFYRTFSEFIRGLYASPGSGRVTKQLEVSLYSLGYVRGSRDRQGSASFCPAVSVPPVAPGVALAQSAGGVAAAALGGDALQGQTREALAAATLQEAAAIAWKIHSAAWVFTRDLRRAAELLAG